MTYEAILEETLTETQARRNDLRGQARHADEAGFDALMAEVDRLTGVIDILMDRLGY